MADYSSKTRERHLHELSCSGAARAASGAASPISPWQGGHKARRRGRRGAAPVSAPSLSKEREQGGREETTTWESHNPRDKSRVYPWAPGGNSLSLISHDVREGRREGGWAGDDIDRSEPPQFNQPSINVPSPSTLALFLCFSLCCQLSVSSLSLARARSRASSALGASGGAGPAERSHDQCRRQLGAGTRLADSSGSTQTEGPRRGKLHHKRARPHHTTVRLANKGVKNWLKNLDEKRGTNSTLLCLLLLFELQLDCN